MAWKRPDDAFVSSYIETALWASNDEADDRGGEPMDRNYGPDDIHEDVRARMERDCKRFLDLAEPMIWREGTSAAKDIELASHLFWLDRVGSGRGFCDGEYPDADGEALSELCDYFGEVHLYVGDDGVIYDYPEKRQLPSAETIIADAVFGWLRPMLTFLVGYS